MNAPSSAGAMPALSSSPGHVDLDEHLGLGRAVLLELAQRRVRRDRVDQLARAGGCALTLRLWSWPMKCQRNAPGCAAAFSSSACARFSPRSAEDRPGRERGSRRRRRTSPRRAARRHRGRVRAARTRRRSPRGPRPHDGAPPRDRVLGSAQRCDPRLAPRRAAVAAMAEEETAGLAHRAQPDVVDLSDPVVLQAPRAAIFGRSMQRPCRATRPRAAPECVVHLLPHLVAAAARARPDGGAQRPPRPPAARIASMAAPTTPSASPRASRPCTAATALSGRRGETGTQSAHGPSAPTPRPTAPTTASASGGGPRAPTCPR